MNHTEIYLPFSDIIKRITGQIKSDLDSLPGDLQDQAIIFLKERLMILRDEKNIQKAKSLDPRVGRPIPYIIMWLADAWGYTEKKRVDGISLGLVYSAIATTIMDDFYDEASTGKDILRLYDHYYLQYLCSFNPLKKYPDFWIHLASSIKEHKKYDTWALNYKPEPGLDPLSDKFLGASSKYFQAVVSPSMAAIAFLSGNEDKIEEIKGFLSHFSKAWRIYDDLVDWEKDIKKPYFNLNSILLAADNREKLLEREDFLFLLLEEDFISEIYDTMIRSFEKSRSSFKTITGKYLEQFLQDQINFHSSMKKTLLEQSRKYKKDFLANIEDNLY